MRVSCLRAVTAALFAAGLAACTDTKTETIEVPVIVPELPACSTTVTTGTCPTISARP